MNILKADVLNDVVTDTVYDNAVSRFTRTKLLAMAVCVLLTFSYNKPRIPLNAMLRTIPSQPQV
jgi:hypothetical protein